MLPLYEAVCCEWFLWVPWVIAPREGERVLGGATDLQQDTRKVCRRWVAGSTLTNSVTLGKVLLVSVPQTFSSIKQG